MPKVLRIMNRFNLGGPTYNASYLTKYLAPEFETKLIGGKWDPSESDSLHITGNLNIEAIVLENMRRSINPLKDYKAYCEIRKIIREFNPDIVHTHAAKAGALGRLAAIKEKVPVIVHTFHGHVFSAYFNSFSSSVFKWIEKRLAKKTDKIIAISPLQKKELAEIHTIAPKDKFAVIPLGFDLGRFMKDQAEKRKIFRKKYLLEDNEVAIGIVGRLVPVKNHHLFLQGIDYLLKKAGKRFRAFIIGDGEDKDNIIHSAGRLGIPYIEFKKAPKKSVLTFTSWIHDIDVAMAGLDIVCLTSLDEGTPVSLIEAQAAGKAIVSTRVGGIENAVIPNKTALLADLENTDMYCKHLHDILENKEQRIKMGVLGQAFVIKRFHYERLVEDVRSLYHELLITT